MSHLLLINGRPFRVQDNPTCNCDHWHYMFQKGSRKPKKFHHKHPHSAKSHLGKSRYCVHKHSSSQKATLRAA